MTGSGPHPRRQPLRRAVRLATAALLAVALNRVTGTVRGRWLVGAQAVTSWALLPAPLLLVIAVARRWPVTAALSAGLAGYELSLVRSGRGRGRPDPDVLGRTSLRLVSANLLRTNPSIRSAGERLLATSVDVLVLQELTPEHLGALRGAGLLDELPHALVRAEHGFHGAGLFSRWPMRDTELIDLDGVPLPVATIETPDGLVRVAAVHAKNPGAPGELGRWRRQLARLGALTARSTVPVVLVGDFNATADHRDFASLLAHGLRDAWDVAGSGLGATWPVWSGPVPPLLRLDHALVGAGVAVRSAVAGDTPGSDHRHLRVQLQLARP